jgi:hypothetical protein
MSRTRPGPSLLALLLAASASDCALAQTPQACIRWLDARMTAKDRDAVPAARLETEVALALEARAKVAWGASLTDAMFLNYVLPFAQANEARDPWRADFQQRFLPLVEDCSTPGEAALKLNATIFHQLGVHYSTGRKRALQSPSESIAQGKASCTGLSILLADACRACCVPARIVSVRWPHKPGNHTWVEVWDGEGWRFVGADEPDPAGLDRAWFVADAARCLDASPEHRIWAVSFDATGSTFAAGWDDDVELHGVDVTGRYGKAAPGQDPASGADEAALAQMDRFFAATAERRADFEFDRNLDAELQTAAGDQRLRRLAFASWRRAAHAGLREDHAANRVRAGGKESPYTVKFVGERPAQGWGLVIAMHGGGGVPKEFNDSQWRHMQVYYKDHPEVSGYAYCALRAPTDEWNGFYTDYFYPLLERLIRQFVVCGDVDPERVIAIGYSHGGYGAFAVGPKLPHRFAAVHASAAAPTDGETSPVGLHTLAFSFMVGGKDTAYGRRSRCEAFAQQLEGLRAQRPGLYATTFSLIEGNGHTGLPDRDLLAGLAALVRKATPGRLHWEPTDGVVRDHYWLRNETPARGQRIDAELRDDGLAVAAVGEPELEAWLDARICAMAQPLRLRIGDQERQVALSASLRVLCETLDLRGDPGLAASCRVKLR